MPQETVTTLDATFSVTLDGQKFAATHINCAPVEDAIVVYTRDFMSDGVPSLTLGKDQTGRTAVCVVRENTVGKTEYSVQAVAENSMADLPIPYNGFVITLPTDALSDLRVRSGQSVAVDGIELLGTQERFDAGYFRPESTYRSALQRRISMCDPYAGVSGDGIYFLHAAYTEQAITLPAESVIVSLYSVTGTSYRISSIARASRVAAGTDQLVFVGSYNCAYAEKFLQVEQKIMFTDLDRVSSYSDIEALVLDETVYRFTDDVHNTERIKEGGVYLFDTNHSSVSTPESEVERVDAVVVDDMIISISEKNSRTMLPLSGGVVITFAGDAVSVVKDLYVGKSVTTVLLDSELLPDEYVRINGIAYGIDKTNTTRAPEGVTALYTPVFGATTQTNMYGIEIAIRDGKVLAVEKGVGDIEIPENGYVLSIHKDSALYNSAMENIEIGDTAVVSLGERNYTVSALTVSGINSVRATDTLIVYRGRPSTATNEYGYEILVNANGMMIGESYSGNAAIPSGGFVLSGHGVNKEALEKAYCYGSYVAFDEKTMQVLLITTPDTILTDASVTLENIKTELQEAKDTLLYLDYTALDAEVAMLDALITEVKEAFADGDFETALNGVSKANAAWDELQYSLLEAHPVENRAIWYRSTEKSDAEVLAVVKKLVSMNINAIYLETWYNGRFVGYSENELIEHATYNGNYDALDGFVRICHEYGIEVHAWVQNFFIGTVEAQEYANQALAKHFEGRWLEDRNGKNTFFYSVSSTNFIFLNPYDTEVRELLIGFYREMIENYDIDGLHLDYIRFPELNYGTDDFGYNENIVSAWQAENNTAVDPASLTSGALYDSWNLFRQEIINSFVGEVYQMVKSTDPSVWLSAAVYPGIPNVKNEIFQDCANWVQNGYMDELFSMSYGADNSYVSANAEKFVSIAGDACFYSTGISAFGETVPQNFARQMVEVTAVGADGVAIFSLANIDASNYLNPIQQGAFRISSVQTNRMSETVSAQLNYILDKAKTVYIPYAGLTEEGYQAMVSLLQPILDDANAFDLENAANGQKLTYCKETAADLQTALEQLLQYFPNESQHEAVAKDITNLISWLTQSENRISARLN